MLAQDLISEQIKFRECRDVIGLNKYMSEIVSKDQVVSTYSIYLYQPINNAIYKKLVISDESIIMSSPSLQGIYLKTQPTINRELIEHSYYLADYNEFISHDDTRFWSSFSNNTRLIYGLKIENKVIGEVWIRFNKDPTPLELERVLKEISPVMYSYIL